MTVVKTFEYLIEFIQSSEGSEVMKKFNCVFSFVSYIQINDVPVYPYG